MVKVTELGSDFKVTVRPTVPLNFDFTETVEIISTWEGPDVWIVHASDIYQQDNRDTVSDVYWADYKLVFEDTPLGSRKTRFPQRDQHSLQVFGTWEEAIEWVKVWKQNAIARFIKREGPANVEHWSKYGEGPTSGTRVCPYKLPEIVREAYIYDGIPLEDVFNSHQTWEIEYAWTDKDGTPLTEDGVNPITDEYIQFWDRPIVKEWAEDVTTKEQVAKWVKNSHTRNQEYDAKHAKDAPPLDWPKIFPHPISPTLTSGTQKGLRSIDDIPPEKSFVGIGEVYLCKRDGTGELEYRKPTDERPINCMTMEWEIRVHKRPVRTL